ncbi:MAG TPA: glucose 1-dehydrogenase [Xanthobacteraceae bacterium]|nr:glucose 1-dehydrogenase [Xanthobacteraceae bacterium]
MRLFDLSGKVAVVTGGNGGIGLGMATGLAQAGAAIVVAGRQKGKNTEAVKKLSGLGVKAIAVEFDNGDEKSCRAMVDESARALGRVDILVNNAGIAIRKPPEAYAAEDWRKVIDVNLSGAFYCSQAAYPHMVKAGGGKIINIGSMLSIFGMPHAVAYGASKGGIVQMSRSIATAWAKDNIQINCLLPGWINTDLTKSARVEVEGLNERVLARTPMKRWGEPEDFAGIAVFFASAASDFITGTAVPVDGGFSMQG